MTHEGAGVEDPWRYNAYEERVASCLNCQRAIFLQLAMMPLQSSSAYPEDGVKYVLRTDVVYELET